MKNILPLKKYNGSKVFIEGLNLDIGSFLPHHKYAALRPEDIVLGNRKNFSKSKVFPGTITKLVSQGFYYHVTINIKNTELMAQWTRQELLMHGLQMGSKIKISLPMENIHTF